MTNPKMRSRDPDILNVMPALQRAARRAQQLGLETNTPVYVMRDGEIVDLTKETREREAREKAGQ